MRPRLTSLPHETVPEFRVAVSRERERKDWNWEGLTLDFDGFYLFKQKNCGFGKTRVNLEAESYTRNWAHPWAFCPGPGFAQSGCPRSVPQKPFVLLKCFFKVVSLRDNSHTVTFFPLKCAAQWGFLLLMCFLVPCFVFPLSAFSCIDLALFSLYCHMLFEVICYFSISLLSVYMLKMTICTLDLSKLSIIDISAFFLINSRNFRTFNVTSLSQLMCYC